ncbi:hypothetical protein [Alkalibacter saccharofermentans]|uniref:Uncharacterized protein n=1 Tax=Alkalibacter saccharofermentans DSM 14828 TaxID=1120975 RepID=A0A1M4VBB9_9FIRM|nr:hypothetical protein [Alkalibacter saccharofermentans]SHE66197.1 hypothetical protein SAMN02746064_00932 [Alkalibacter saccharofermentans DSM 14828]
MFVQNTLKTITNGLLLIFLLVASTLLNAAEFLQYFIADNTHSFLELPLETASVVEFFVQLILTLLVLAISIWMIRMQKDSVLINYFICIWFMAINIFKLIFYIPNISFDQEYIWFALKQFIPLIPCGLITAMAFLKLTDLKYEKY